jgi:hypothetical protein
MRALLAITALCLMAPAASADVTIGLFAPTAPFESSGDRVSFVNGLAGHLKGAAGGQAVIGKVYADAGAFAAAIKKGEIQFAVIDAPFGASNGLPYTILGAATREGSPAASWQLVAKSTIRSMRDLRGTKVAVPATGSRAQAFVTNVLLGGEVDASFFAGITEAPDGRSAVTMVSVGKVDAAFVPAGVDVPGGTTRLATLTSVGWPMFVALPGADAKLVTAFSSSARSFGGGGGFGGFVDPSGAHYRQLAGSFGKATKKGPMALPPPARLSSRDLLVSRSFPVPLSNVLDVVAAPPPPAPAQ